MDCQSGSVLVELQVICGQHREKELLVSVTVSAKIWKSVEGKQMIVFMFPSYFQHLQQQCIFTFPYEDSKGHLGSFKLSYSANKARLTET